MFARLAMERERLDGAVYTVFVPEESGSLPISLPLFQGRGQPPRPKLYRKAALLFELYHVHTAAMYTHTHEQSP